ncbi:Thiamin-phosphate pyrophosphorylase [hydrothermal vent metagenome]|uniref:Thiamin-phosphate pyrophosphorylase n=1 Tax=hydrothermal vent metagenome TaxID=652676 RepID=A0A3B0R7V0_9ZZZZ
MIATKLLNILPEALRLKADGIINGEDGHGQSRRGALLAFFIRVASAAIAFFSQVLLARWIGAHEYGVFTYVWVWINIIGTLCAAGFATSVVRFLPEYQETGQHDLVRGFLRTGRAFSSIMGLLATLGGLLILYLLDGAVPDYYRVSAAVALIALPAFALTDFQDGVGRSQGWIDLALIPPYIIRPFLLFSFIGAAVAIGWNKNAETAVYAAIAATWATAVLQYWMQKKRMLTTVPAGPRQYKFGFWLKVSLPVIAIESFAMLMTNMDILLLDLFVTPAEIAVYFAAARTISLMAFVHFSVTAAVTPKFATLYASGDLDGLQKFLKQTRQWTLIPSLIGGVILLTLGKPILWLFGPEFTAGYPAMFALVIGLLARSFAGPLQGLMIATGRQNIAALALGMAVVINVAFNFLLIPKFGLVGAAAATAIAFTVESILLYVITRRIFSGPPSEKNSRGADVASAK